MRAVKGQGNRSTELKLRGALIQSGVSGWKIQPKNIDGRPDFGFPKIRVAVFVDGCFWHGCPQCYRRPKTSRDYWDQKVARNIARDRGVIARLRRKGWSVIRLWEHDAQRSAKACVERIVRTVSQRRP
jgi:DNA mismatch endonuclease Vsr